MRIFLKIFAGVFFLLLVSAAPGRCGVIDCSGSDLSLSLASSTTGATGVFTYDVVEGGDLGCNLVFGTTLALTGMANVTGAAVTAGSALSTTPYNLTVSNVTSTTATLTFGGDFFFVPVGSAESFTISCSNCASGSIGYSFATGPDPAINGPVAPSIGAPEPGTLALLLTGLFALLGLVAMKRSHVARASEA